MPENVSVTDVEVLTPGTYTDANGKVVAVSLDDLHELADEYDPQLLDAPAVVGHPKMADPAYGWMRNLRVEGDMLLCDLADVDPDFAESLRAKRYKHKSLSFFLPRSKGNPKPGKLYPRHLGLLGARAPAVKGLKPIQLAADDDAVVIELAAPGWSWRLPWVLRNIAETFRRQREQTIASTDLETADRVIPAYVIDDLGSAATEIEAAGRAEDVPPSFASPNNQGGQMATPEDLAQREAKLQEREAALAAREKSVNEQAVSLAAAEADARRKEDAAFVGGLIEAGKLAPGEKDNVLAELAALDDLEVTIELASGDDGQPAKLTPHAAYKRRLDQAPVMVRRGEFKPKGGDLGVIDFAAPDGCVVDQGSLDLHRRAAAYQQAHPSIDYLSAVKAVQG